MVFIEQQKFPAKNIGELFIEESTHFIQRLFEI